MYILDRISGFAKLLFPQKCIICAETCGRHRDLAICDHCYQLLPFNQHACTRCAIPLPADISDGNAQICGRCIQSAPEFDYAISTFKYEKQLVSLVHQLKYRDRLSWAKPLGLLMLDSYLSGIHHHSDDQTGNQVDYHADIQALPDLIVPVPLHSTRLYRRGFNQSTELARELARKLDVRLDVSGIQRSKSTSAQAGLKLQQRKANIRGAFTCKNRYTGLHVLIVDDVLTTGSTVNELTKLIKQNGAKKVGVLTLARVEAGGKREGVY